MADENNNEPTLKQVLRQLADRKRELDLKEREVAAKEREVLVREQELKRSRWSSPLLVGILGTIAALTGTAITALNNRSNAEFERTKEQSAILLEAIKTDKVQACTNLKFLVAAGLLEDRNGAIASTCATEFPSIK